MIRLMLFFMLVCALMANADQGGTGETKQSLDLNNIVIDGLDEAVREVFQQTKAVIEDAREQNNKDLEFSASKEWCLLLHNFEFLAQAKACYFVIGLDDKKEPKWPYLYAKASLEQGQMDDAKVGFEQTIKRDNNYLSAHYHLVNMTMQNGELREAFVLASQVPPELQLTSSMLKLSGDLYFGVENYHIAIGFYQQALSLVEGAKSLHYKIAQAYGSLGQQELAQQHLSKANQVGIQVPDPYYQEVKNTTVGEVPHLIKAKAALVNGDLIQAIAGYQTALKYNPNSLTAQLNMAVAYFQNKQIDKAQSLFEKVLDSDPLQTTALFNLAIINKSQGANEVAQKHLEKFMTIDASDRAVNVNLAEVYYRLNQHDKVMALTGADVFKTDEVMQSIRAQSLVQLEQYEEAINLLEAIHQHRPKNREVQLKLVKLYSQVPDVSLIDIPRAVEFAQKAVATQKDHITMWQLATVMDRAQQCDELITVVRDMAQMLQIDVKQVIVELQQQRGDDINCQL